MAGCGYVKWTHVTENLTSIQFIKSPKLVFRRLHIPLFVVVVVSHF